MSNLLVSPDELLEFASGVDWATVADNASFSDPRQAIEQSRMIARASAWAANFCEQPQRGQQVGGLHASTQTETARTLRSAYPGCKTWISRDGWLHWRADTLPLLGAHLQPCPGILSSQWGYLAVPVSWVPIPPGNWYVDGQYPQVRHLIEASHDWTWLRQVPALVQVTYTSGWLNAVLTGSTGITAGTGVSALVDSSLGALAGDVVHIVDGSASEDVVVTSAPDATHLVLARVANAHLPGTMLTAVPDDIRHAVLLACTWAAKHPRGSAVLEMAGVSEHNAPLSGGLRSDDEMASAENLLEPYVRRT